MRSNENGTILRRKNDTPKRLMFAALAAFIGLTTFGQSYSQGQGILQRLIDRRAQMRRAAPAQPHRTQSSLNSQYSAPNRVQPNRAQPSRTQPNLPQATAPQYRQQYAPAGQIQSQQSGQIVIDPRTGRAYIVNQPVRRPAAAPQSVAPQPNIVTPNTLAPLAATPNAVVRQPNTSSTKEDMKKYGNSILNRGPQSTQTTAKPAVTQSSTGDTKSTRPSPKRPTLGIEIEERPGVRGVTVVKVTPDSPAQTAGLSVGDRIVSVNGEMVAGTKFMVKEVGSRSIGDSMDLQVVRGKQLVSSKVTFTEMGSSTSPNDIAKTEPAKKSAMEQVGSALGGLIGGKNPNKQSAPANSDVASSQGDSKTKPYQPKPVIQASAEEDALDFGDDEPISQAIFDSNPIEAPSVDRTLERDPPSAKRMTPPPAETPVSLETSKSSESGKSVEELQSEIERLQKELESAKKKVQ